MSEPRTVYKYPVDSEEGIVYLPKDAKVVHMGFQGVILTIWAEVVPSTRLIPDARRVKMLGTGWDVPEGFSHIWTWIDDGGLVWHFYLEDA